MSLTTSPTEHDYKALITCILLIMTGIVTVYGMHLKWAVTEILALLAFFGPMDTAAVTYYFVSKQIAQLKST